MSDRLVETSSIEDLLRATEDGSYFSCSNCGQRFMSKSAGLGMEMQSHDCRDLTIQRLRAALSFYADEENWKPQDSWCPARGNIALQSSLQKDKGQTAREALNDR